MKYLQSFYKGFIQGLPYGTLIGGCIALCIINPLNIPFLFTVLLSLYVICIA